MFALFFVVIILSALDYYDIMVKNVWATKLKLIFSIKRNMKFVFDVKRKDNRLGCLDGIKTYLGFCVILIHNYFETIQTIDLEQSLFKKRIKGNKSIYYNKLYMQHNFILISGSKYYK